MALQRLFYTLVSVYISVRAIESSRVVFLCDIALFSI